MVLITGASGFVGGALAEYLSYRYLVRALVRNCPSSLNPSIEYVPGFELSGEANFGNIFSGVKVAIHCAARVHVMSEVAANPLEEFRRVNVQGTINFATQAARAGVKRFIYLSSVKVNGESTKAGKPFRPEDTPRPLDPYGISKLEAELALQILSSKTGMEIVIIRPPLIYGRGVKANFAALIGLVKLGIPLPFGLANKNFRSFLAIDNLLSFIEECIANPKAANQIFLISDGHDLSTTSLLNEIALAGNQKIFQLPIPISILKAVLRIAGKSDISERLFGNLQVDISKCYDLLKWVPPMKIRKALQLTIAGVHG
jgi:nucleoside-diphosphate-sugar epimerase